LGQWPRNSFSGNICFEFSVLVLCSAQSYIVFLQVFEAIEKVKNTLTVATTNCFDRDTADIIQVKKA
jgi:hypothetical protein